MNRFEPFSPHRPWDEMTHQAYREQPEYNGYHYRLTEKCTESQKQHWRDWCRKYPDHWPGHVRDYIDSLKGKKP